MIRDSVFIDLTAGHDRRDAKNTRTRFPGVQDGLGMPFRAAFVRHYETARATNAAFQQAGLVVLAVDAITGALAGRACIAIQPGRPRALVLGRHARADLFLAGDATLSLRHAVILLAPAASWSEVRYRVVDLRSGTGFLDERGRRLAAFETDGASMLRCGRYVILILTTSGAPDEWLQDADAAWDALPERVYMEERLAEPDRWARRSHRGSGQRKSLITVLGSVCSAHEPVSAPDEPAFAQIDVHSPRGHLRLRVSNRVLARGLLFGRDDRCDGSGVLGDAELSRCHLLFFELGGDLWALDTSSTNGSFLVRDARRSVLGLERLALTDRIVLGDDRAMLRLTPIA